VPPNWNDVVVGVDADAKWEFGLSWSMKMFWWWMALNCCWYYSVHFVVLDLMMKYGDEYFFWAKEVE
jgi:hypothetical protein